MLAIKGCRYYAGLTTSIKNYEVRFHLTKSVEVTYILLPPLMTSSPALFGWLLASKAEAKAVNELY